MFRPVTSLLLLCCWGTVVHAQQNDYQDVVPPATAIGVPGQITGVWSPLTTADEIQPTNHVLGRVGASATFDDNATNAGTSMIGDWEPSFSSQVAFEHVSPKAVWNIDYAGGVTLSQKLRDRNLVTHAMQASLGYRLAPHVTLQLRQTYDISSDPFNDASVPLSGTTRTPGDVSSYFVTPVATRTMMSSSGGITWQTGPHAVLGFAGGISSLRFSNVADEGLGQTLRDTRVLNFHLFYGRRVSRRHTMGFQMGTRNIWFPGLPSRTRSFAVQYLDTIRLSNHMEISVFGGPEQARTQDFSTSGTSSTLVPVRANQVLFSGGTSLSWRGLHRGLRVAYEQGVGDSGGTGGAVRLQVATAELRTNIGRQWVVASEGLFANGRVLVPTVIASQNTTTASVGIGLERAITRDLFFRTRYARVRQLQNTVVTGDRLTANHNRVETGLMYQFSRPFGGK